MQHGLQHIHNPFNPIDSVIFVNPFDHFVSHYNRCKAQPAKNAKIVKFEQCEGSLFHSEKIIIGNYEENYDLLSML